jgi:hypothetical protein
MGHRVDYAQVKRTTTIQAVAEWLGLKRRSDTRLDCPHASNGERAISISPDWKNKDGTFGRFTCFACDVSGDMIALAAHINKTDDRTAAQEIEQRFTGYTPAKKGLPPDGFQDIDCEHERVLATGITAEQARYLGVGYRNRGVTKDAVIIPIRDKSGALITHGLLTPDGFRIYNKFTVK